MIRAALSDDCKRMTLPCYLNFLHVPRDSLIAFDAWIGLDGGCSLIKVAFVEKSTELDELLRIHLCSFTDIQSASMHLKTKAWIPAAKSSPRIFYTGVTAAKHLEELRALFPNYELTFIDENQAHINGFHFLRSNATDSLSELFFVPPESHRHHSSHCCHEIDVLLFVFGSGLMGHRISCQGEAISFGDGLHGGHSLVELSSLLLGIHDYDELMLEASRGDRSAIGTKVREFLTSVNDSQNESYNDDHKTITFAPPAFKRRKIIDHRREDIAAGLVGVFSNLLVQQVVAAAAMTGIEKVYITGNTCKSEVFRNSFYKDLAGLCSDPNVRVLFLRSGDLAALGAMTMK